MRDDGGHAAGYPACGDQYLLSYFLAAAELGIGVLSLAASRLQDAGAVRVIALSYAAFHAATASLEVFYMVTVGASAVLIANVVVRVVVAVVFVVVVRGQRADPLPYLR